MNLLQNANSLSQTLTAHRRHLHQNAHTGFSTENADYVKRELTALGLTPTDCGKAGVITTIGSGDPVILLRADMDALPMKEQTDLPYASVTGCMHACGHDLHTAMLLGAAKLLKEQESTLCGTVKLMFQPAEETLEGAPDMIADGVLADPKPDAAIMLHVIAGDLPIGSVFVSKEENLMPSADYFTITVDGKSCHGSTPEQGIDALTPAAHILLALQEIHARELSTADRAVLTIGTMQGGSAPNILADHVEMKGTLRCYDEVLREKIKTRMAEIADSIAKAYRASASIEFPTGTPMFRNDQTLAAPTAASAAKLLGKDRVFYLPGSGAGSEDFAYISRLIPTVMVSLAAADNRFPLHHPQVVFDESVLPIGAALLAQTAIDWLKGK